MPLTLVKKCGIGAGFGGGIKSISVISAVFNWGTVRCGDICTSNHNAFCRWSICLPHIDSWRQKAQKAASTPPPSAPYPLVGTPWFKCGSGSAMLWLQKWRRGHVLSSPGHRTFRRKHYAASVYTMCLALQALPRFFAVLMG